jgi:hypothetical protein
MGGARVVRWRQRAKPDPFALGNLASSFNAVGAFALPAGSRDAAVELTLAPGGYTVHVSPATGATGEVLIEIYEVP